MTPNPYDELRQVIRGVRNRWRLKVALRGAAMVVAAGLVTVAVSAYAMDHFRYEPWAVTSFRLFAYVTLAALAARLLIVPLWGRVSEERVALYVEEHEPSLQASVLSAIDTGKHAPGARPDLSRALVERLVETAIEKCQTIDYGRHVERRGLRRASGLLAAAAALGMLVAILSPAFLRHAAPFLFAPWSLGGSKPYAIEVDPGHVTIPRGGSQTVTARLRGFDSEVVDLAVRPAAGGDWKRWPMTADGEAEGFRFVLFGLDANSEYYVEANGVRSDRFRLDVADVPYVKRVDLEYHFPAYSGLPPHTVEDTGDIAALEGTEVRVRVTPTMKVASGRLHVEGAPPLAMTASPDGTLTATLQVQKEGFYRVEMPGRDGALKTASPDYTIDVIADQPPTVSFTRPGRDAKVTSVEEVFTELKAEDDFGVARAELVYSVNGGPEKTVVVHKGKGRKALSAGHTFFLEEHTLEPGDFVSYFARVADESPARHAATTDIYFMEVRPFNREYRQAEQGGMAGGGAGAESGGALSYQQRQIIAATFKIVRDRARIGDKQHGEDLATLALVQGRLHDQVQSLLRRMGNRGPMEPGSGFAKTAESLRAATTEMASARSQLESRKAKEALAPEQAALKHLQRAEAAFREVQVAFGDNQAGGGAGDSSMDAEELADLFELELDKLKNQYETVQRGEQKQADEQVDEALERLRELARRQEQENERQRRLAGRPPNMGGSSGGSQRALADETEELARRLERLAREKSNPAMQDTARRLQDAANAMRRASSGAEGGAMGEAMSALDRLKEARQRLERERTGRLDRDVQQAARAAEDLRRAQQKIAEEAEREVAGQSGARSAGGTGMQRLMERKEELEAQVGALEGQLDRMARDARTGGKEQPGQKDAARRLQEASDTIRDRKLKDKIRYSKGVVRAGAAEQSRQLENEIGSDIAALGRKLEEAARAAGGGEQDKRRAAMDKMRELARGLESAQERVQDAAEEARRRGKGAAGGEERGPQAAGGEEKGAERSARGQGAEQGTAGARDQAGGDGDRTAYGGEVQDGRNTGGVVPNFGADRVRQLRRELRERAREADALGRDLRGTGDLRGLPEVLRDLRRLEDERIYADPRALATLLGEIVEGLKTAELALRRDVEGPDRQKLLLTGSQDLPPGWKPLVEEYYRSLSRKTEQ